MTEQTEPLKNGAKLPDHPANTTARKVTKYGHVKDAHTDILCVAGLHENEISMLKRGEVGGLSHLHRYAIRDGKIYHTRSRVVIEVQCVDDDADIQ